MRAPYLTFNHVLSKRNVQNYEKIEWFAKLHYPTQCTMDAYLYKYKLLKTNVLTQSCHLCYSLIGQYKMSIINVDHFNIFTGRNSNP